MSTKDNKKDIVTKQNVHIDPYLFYFDRFYASDEYDPEYDGMNGEYNAQAFKDHLREQFITAKAEKKEWITDAMEGDPAFMENPLEDYYLRLIPAELRKDLTPEERETVVGILDPVLWAEKHLFMKHGGFKSRISASGIPFQSQIMRCKSKRMVIRAGRRLGKTMAIVARLLHRVYTWNDTKKPYFNIVIFTPNQSQIRMIFKMMAILIDDDHELKSMVGGRGDIPTRQQPVMELTFKNGVTIQGFVSGSDAVRGADADILWLDEASFLTPDDTDAVVALINSHPNVEQIITSTPKGMKDWFYERVYDDDFVSFYFPANKFHPNWSRKLEADFKKQLTHSGYKHEVLADFSDDGEGVFQKLFVDAMLEDYEYDDLRYDSACYYGMGVDWNDRANGTQIRVFEFSPVTNLYRCVAKESVHIEGWTQTEAIERIKLLNRKWHCNVIYVDEGHGGVQIELLHQAGTRANKGSADHGLLKVKGIDFGKSIEVMDPYRKTISKKQAKAFMVHNTSFIIENGLCKISMNDELLIKQLYGYRIKSIRSNNVPVYEPDPKHGDHHLDAMMLALMGFVCEYSSLMKPRLPNAMRAASNPLENNIMKQNNVVHDPAQKARDAMLLRDKAAEALENDRYTSISARYKTTGLTVRRNSLTHKTFKRQPFQRRSSF